MKILSILGTLILLLALSGCYDATEPNDYAYVVAIGIDKSEKENEYEISVQFAKPSQISGGSSEQGGSGGETLGLITVEAPTIYSGINIANNLLSKRFQLSHTKIIVVSEEIAKEGINDIIYTVVRSTDLRPNMYVAVAKDSAKEYLASVEPEMEINPVKYYQLIFENTAAEYVPKSFSQHIYFYINSDERDVCLPIVAKSKEPEKESKESTSGSGQGGKKGQKSGSNESQEENTKLPQIDPKTNYDGFEYLEEEYVAGEVLANKKNKSEAMGTAVFSGDKMVGELSNVETEIYNILDGSFIYNYNTFYSEEYPKEPMVMTVRQYKPPTISLKIKDKKPEIYVKINMEGSLVSVAGNYLLEEDIYKNEKRIEGYIKKDVEKFLYKTSKDLGTDILGFGTRAKKEFINYSEFEKFDWPKAYKDAEFQVDVDFSIRRTGLIIKK